MNGLAEPLPAVCDRCGAKEPSPAAAALEGWIQWATSGVVVDLCPACQTDEERAQNEAIIRRLEDQRAVLEEWQTEEERAADRAELEEWLKRD